MTAIEIAHDGWELIESPRRYKQVLSFRHAERNVSFVAAWEESLDPNGMRQAEVDVLLTAEGIEIESTYKFHGELRVL